MLPRLLLVSAGVSGALACLTILASDVAWPVIVAVWTAIGAVIGGWVWAEESRSHRARIKALASALEQSQVRETRIRARALVTFEEESDEGACHAFELGDGSVVFVVGQEFYPSAGFPNTDFSLVSVHDRVGRLVEFYIDKHGKRLPPVRTISAVEKRRLRMPEHLERIDVALADLERALAL